MYKYQKDYFKNIDTEEKAYWAGFIAADGNIRKDFLKMRIELNIQDKKHLEKFRENLNSDVPIKESIRQNNHSCYIDINCKELCLDLVRLGIVPNKSLILNIDFKLIPNHLVPSFIRGYFDGDGSINFYDKRGYLEYELSFIGTEIFLEKVLFFLQKKKKLFSCGNNFRFCLKSKKDISEVLKYFYNNPIIFLDRKYLKVQEFEALNDYQATT